MSIPHKGAKHTDDTKSRTFVAVPLETERVASEIADAAFKVHSALGPGLLEAVYKACLIHELSLRRLVVQTEVGVPIVYEGLRLATGLKLDLLIGKQVIVELKAVERMNSLFEAQLLSYLRLTRLRLGFLINFNVPLIKSGIKRIVL